MTVSIIIAVKTWQKNLEECVNKCRELAFSDFEILVLPDEPFREGPLRDEALRDCPLPDRQAGLRGAVSIKVIPTGPVSPADKRDLAISHAQGEILAFIDDDAYPVEDWLKYAVENFRDPDIACVGGPAVTPPEDSVRQKASGAIYASLLVSGNFSYRYLPKKRMVIDDYPSCNLFVRKSVMLELGGFNTKFWPGEDTKLCLDITKKLKKKIIYDPRVLVYHHRRPVYLPHLRQISSYALHRGYFVRKYPETSRKLSYFLPTCLALYCAIGLFCYFLLPSFKAFYLFSIFLYLLCVLAFSFSREWRLIPLVFLGIIPTHLSYGVFFLKGLISKKLREE